ncbi:hypothetical protein GGI42DRAFT_297597 [Trichoderma sp. SZMC 28013]
MPSASADLPADHQTRVNTFRNPRPRPKPCFVICSGRRPSRNLLLLSKSITRRFPILEQDGPV